ncbi:MAG TPA: hypothetical protein PLD99_01230 [Parcubacteria group bacterium]|nr:hypothetical protein [Parcubacteria group bacterium]
MPTDLRSLVNIFLGLINPLILVLAGLSLLMFFRGLLNFIIKSDDTKSLEEGKEMMKWGLVGLGVMVSIWGILTFFYSGFGWGQMGFPLLPENGRV